jgi:AGCS family alanine or glycine:cation symporter
VLAFGDLMILGLAIPNLAGVYLLHGKVKAALDDYWGKYQRGELKTYK